VGEGGGSCGEKLRLISSRSSSSWQQFPLLALWLFCFLILNLFVLYFFVFVCVGGMQKSLKLILIFDLCQTNLRARHQTAQIRQIILISTLSVALTQIPNHKKSFAKYFANEIRKSIILKHKTAKRKGDNETDTEMKWSGEKGRWRAALLGTLAKLSWRRQRLAK